MNGHAAAVPCLLLYMTGFYVAAGFTFQQILFVSADLQHAALLLSWLVYNQPCSALQRSCNLLTVAAGEARPPAVRTTAQPYTAGRPTPPRLPYIVSKILRRAGARRALRDAPRSACPAPRQQILRQLANLPRVSLNGIFRCPINSGERKGDTHAVTGCSVGFEIH